MTKNITKRTVSGVLAVLCAAGVMMAQPYVGGVAADTAVTVSADKIFGDYEYKVLDDGTAEITKYTGSDKVVEIPSEIGGYVLTSIGQRAFAFCTSLESVSIPDSVTTIGQKAFAACFFTFISNHTGECDLDREGGIHLLLLTYICNHTR